MKKFDIDIENILNSFDNASKVEARPFMHTRVLAKLQDDKSVYSFITKPALVYIISLTLVVLNLVAIYYNTTKETEDITNLATNSSMFNYSDGSTNNNFFLTATSNNY